MEAPSEPAEGANPTTTPTHSPRRRVGLREWLAWTTVLILLIALTFNLLQSRKTLAELYRLRDEAGYLAPTSPEEIAAAWIPSQMPLTYRLRIRTPEPDESDAEIRFGSGNLRSGYRIAYSTMWRRGTSNPQWYSALPVPSGESVVTIRVMMDPRDGIWKVAAISTSPAGTKRMATTLPEEHTRIFRGSHEILSTGIPRGQTVRSSRDQSMRLLDERWLVGEGALLLYGDREPEEDQIGIYAELQPDIGPL